MKNYDYVLCVSYGNDSIAMIQLIHEMQLKNVALLYNDTGWADKSWPARIIKMKDWATSLNFDCFETISIGMEALVKSRKGWPRQGMQFCTTELKIKPTIEWLEKFDANFKAICCVGIKK